MERTVRVTGEGKAFYNQATMCVGTGRMDLALQEEYQQHLTWILENVTMKLRRKLIENR